jgi:hypothetical protein
MKMCIGTIYWGVVTQMVITMITTMA